ncbi:MAG: glycosyltransferase family 4 protein, partial [Candidatus Bathyarchaeota archaeon]|nr:glycosyltransferase family 4 protein [Candidatus Bathyarchaeota archaeon]
MKVTLIGSLPPQKGISPYVRELAAALAARDDVDLEVLSFRSLYPRWLYPGGDPSDGTSTPPQIPSARLRNVLTWWNPLGWIIAGLSLRGYIVHAQWWSFFLAPAYMTLLALARLRGKRVIVTVHNAEPHESGILRRLANRAVLPFAHRHVVHTEQNRRTLLTRGMSEQRIAVVPIGIGSPVRIDNKTARSARQHMGLAKDAPVVLFLGNIRPYKGLEDLLAAFRQVVNTLPEARLVIAGQPWGKRDGLSEHIRRLGLQSAVLTRFEFIPDRAVADYFAAADVAAYPYTHFDAQSAAVCDALRHGCAIVVTNVGGLPDIVDDPAAVVPPGAADLLAQALIRVLSDPALREKLEADSR